MPPAISDDDSSDVDAHLPVASWRDDDTEEALPTREVPSRRRSASARAAIIDTVDSEDRDDSKTDGNGNGNADKEDQEDKEDDEDEEGDGDDVYIVEAIKKHIIDEDGSLRFLVKWEGYDKKSDMTWEPEDNLEQSANEVLEEYFARIGGRDNVFKQTEAATRGKKRGRKPSTAAAGEESASASADAAPMKRSRRSNGAGRHPGHSTPPASAKPWSPPAGSWEDEIESIDACHDDGSNQLMVYLVWKNGKKTRHQTAIIYKKCPQKMLQFYEKHIKIVKTDEDL